VPRSHDIRVTVEGQQIEGWQSGNIESSMITPADSFVMRIAADTKAWLALRNDARVTVEVDGVVFLDGYIDRRQFKGRAGVIEIAGRDRVGRLVDESAPAVNYSGLTITEAVKRLASPWFSELSLTNAKNRRVRRGKGRRVAGGNEPLITINVRVPRRGNVHPGETRWNLIHEIVSRAGLIAYSSSDGKELILGKPNRTQPVQYEFALGSPGSRLRTTVRELDITEDSGERFSMYMCGGVGGQSDTNYGKNVTDNRGVVFDNIFNRKDGTGRDFLRPKRMYLPERAFDSFGDAQRVAENEQKRRDYKRHLISVECETFGQVAEGSNEPTLFTPDTVARVFVEQLGIDDKYLVVSCSYSFSRDNAETTTMHLIPVETELVL
jgi:prophage tail gpP-like protein